ncbi:4-carboxymuconolactone decarboxylase [Marmoricola sp. URHA0025 HA25]
MRIPPVENPDAEQAALLSKTLAGPGGAPLNLFSTMVRWPELMRRVSALGGYFLTRGALTATQRELAILRTAALLGSEYELTQHRWIAADMGIATGSIEAAAHPDRAAAAWGPAEAAVMALVGEVVEVGDLTEATWTTARELLGEDATVEAVLLVGFYRMLAGFISVAGVQVDLATRRSLGSDDWPAENNY